MWSDKTLVEYDKIFLVQVFELPANNTQDLHCFLCRFSTLGRHTEPERNDTQILRRLRLDACASQHYNVINFYLFYFYVVRDCGPRGFPGFANWPSGKKIGNHCFTPFTPSDTSHCRATVTHPGTWWRHQPCRQYDTIRYNTIQYN